MPNNSFNISRILGKVIVIFWKILAFFIDNLKTFRHCYKNTVIIRSFIYCIYQQLRPNFESYLTPQLNFFYYIPSLVYLRLKSAQQDGRAKTYFFLVFKDQ
jgi:hypothetical protein